MKARSSEIIRGAITVLALGALTVGLMVDAPGLASAEVNIPTTYSTPNANVVNVVAPPTGAQSISVTLDSTIPAPYEPSGHTDFSDGWFLEVYALNADGGFMTEAQLSDGAVIPLIGLRVGDSNSPYKEIRLVANATPGQATEFYNITFPNLSGTAPNGGITSEFDMLTAVEGLLFNGGDGSNGRGRPSNGTFPLSLYFLNSNGSTELTATQAGVDEWNRKPTGYENSPIIGTIFNMYQVDSHTWDGTSQEATVKWYDSIIGSGYFDLETGEIQFDRVDADLETVTEELSGFMIQGDVQRYGGTVEDYEKIVDHTADQLLKNFQGEIGNGSPAVYGQFTPNENTAGAGFPYELGTFVVLSRPLAGEDATTVNDSIQVHAVPIESRSWSRMKATFLGN